MKTIFITLSRGAIARNIFHTDVYRVLREAGVRLVFLTTAWNNEEFTRALSAPNVFFEPLPRAKWGILDVALIGLAKGLIYNRSTELVDRYGIYSIREANYLRYLLKRFFFAPLSRFRFLRTALRFVDQRLTLDHALIPVFEKYKPDLVYSTNPSESDDATVLKCAKHLGVPTVEMPKSWDNLSKLSFRSKADTLLAWSEYVKDDAMKFQDYAPNEIRIVGIPHFDIYARKEPPMSREDFFRAIGADSNKRLLLFGSEGKVSANDADIVETIIGFMKKHELAKECQLFIRPYFSFSGDEKKFTRFNGVPDVIIDRWFKPNNAFYDHWDYSREQYEFMANLLRHSDMMVTSMSTLTLDASANDLPVVNIAYDGYETKPYGESMTRYYDSEHYWRVVETGAPWLTRNAQELKEAINAYLTNPSIRRDGRRRLVDYFCAPLDGRAGERVARFLLERAGARLT
ncbi:MAG: CDP-glycerol glycerophosphotransferase family protein [Patescibacteria group bacterium]